jgi:hypothetical protein
MKLYAHPFSSYCQKVLIALYENDVPFALRHPGPVRLIPEDARVALRKRLLLRPSFARIVDEARPHRALFPLGAPDRD